MEFKFERYRKQIIAFTASFLATAGCFFVGWILIIISPVIVFIIFKVLKVWKSKERIGYGIPAIIIGSLLFFAIFAYQMTDIPSQKFTDENMSGVIKPYSTSDFEKDFNVEITYKNTTNNTLHYVVNDALSNEEILEGDVTGEIKNNETKYKFNITVEKGIYLMRVYIGNDTNNSLYLEMIKEKTSDFFYYLLYFSGVYVISILSVLYGLLIFGVHIIRRGREMMEMRYERKT